MSQDTDFKNCMFFEPIEENSLWRNKKNQRMYRVLKDNVRNCTNAQDGERMVLYTDQTGQMYVRFCVEFREKFELVAR